MTVLRVSGTPNVQSFVKTASTALDANGFVNTSSGQLVKSAADDKVVLGICLETIASTDADYATARPVLVDMVDPKCVLQITVTGAGFDATKVGYYFDLSDDLTVDATESTAPGSVPGGLVMCVGYISATLGLFMLSGAANLSPSA